MEPKIQQPCGLFRQYGIAISTSYCHRPASPPYRVLGKKSSISLLSLPDWPKREKKDCSAQMRNMRTGFSTCGL